LHYMPSAIKNLIRACLQFYYTLQKSLIFLKSRIFAAA
jgi:hypothetical protein